MSEYQCPDCQQSVTLPDSLAPNTQLRCPVCGAISAAGEFREIPPDSQEQDEPAKSDGVQDTFLFDLDENDETGAVVTEQIDYEPRIDDEVTDDEDISMDVELPEIDIDESSTEKELIEHELNASNESSAGLDEVNLIEGNDPSEVGEATGLPNDESMASANPSNLLSLDDDLEGDDQLFIEHPESSVSPSREQAPSEDDHFEEVLRTDGSESLLDTNNTDEPFIGVPAENTDDQEPETQPVGNVDAMDEESNGETQPGSNAQSGYADTEEFNPVVLPPDAQEDISELSSIDESPTNEAFDSDDEGLETIDSDNLVIKPVNQPLDQPIQTEADDSSYSDFSTVDVESEVGDSNAVNSLDPPGELEHADSDHNPLQNTGESDFEVHDEAGEQIGSIQDQLADTDPPLETDEVPVVETAPIEAPVDSGIALDNDSQEVTEAASTSTRKRSRRSKRKDPSARGLEPINNGRKPTLAKRAMQWGAGGIVGVGLAIGGLYLAGQFPSQSESIAAAGPDKSTTSNPVDPPDNNVVPADDPPEPIPQPVDDTPEDVPATPTPAVEPDDSPVVEPSTDPVDESLNQVLQSLQTFRDNEINGNLGKLYVSLCALGEQAIEKVGRRRETEIRALVKDFAVDRSLWDRLRKATPKWLAKSDRTNKGVFLVAKIGPNVASQQRAGYSAASVQWEQTEENPVIVFGPTELLLPFQGKLVVLIGAIEEYPGDIEGEGTFVNIGSLHQLSM